MKRLFTLILSSFFVVACHSAPTRNIVEPVPIITMANPQSVTITRPVKSVISKRVIGFANNVNGTDFGWYQMPLSDRFTYKIVGRDASAWDIGALDYVEKVTIIPGPFCGVAPVIVFSSRESFSITSGDVLIVPFPTIVKEKYAASGTENNNVVNADSLTVDLPNDVKYFKVYVLRAFNSLDPPNNIAFGGGFFDVANGQFSYQRCDVSLIFSGY